MRAKKRNKKNLKYKKTAEYQITKTAEVSKYDTFFDIKSNHLDYQKGKSNISFGKVAIQPPTLRISNHILISKNNDLVFNPLNINQKKKNYVEILEKKNLYKYQYILFTYE